MRRAVPSMRAAPGSSSAKVPASSSWKISSTRGLAAHVSTPRCSGLPRRTTLIIRSPHSPKALAPRGRFAPLSPTREFDPDRGRSRPGARRLDSGRGPGGGEGDQERLRRAGGVDPGHLAQRGDRALHGRGRIDRVGDGDPLDRRAVHPADAQLPDTRPGNRSRRRPRRTARGLIRRHDQELLRTRRSKRLPGPRPGAGVIPAPMAAAPRVAPAHLAIRFALELALLAAYAYWGWHLGDGGVAGTLLAVTLPVGAAALWGIFKTPGDTTAKARARGSIPGVARLRLSSPCSASPATASGRAVLARHPRRC